MGPFCWRWDGCFRPWVWWRSSPPRGSSSLLSCPIPTCASQAVQTVQLVHFLWPPFLFASRSRQLARMIRAQMEALVNNLPYL